MFSRLLISSGRRYSSRKQRLSSSHIMTATDTYCRKVTGEGGDSIRPQPEWSTRGKAHADDRSPWCRDRSTHETREDRVDFFLLTFHVTKPLTRDVATRKNSRCMRQYSDFRPAPSHTNFHSKITFIVNQGATPTGCLGNTLSERPARCIATTASRLILEQS